MWRNACARNLFIGALLIGLPSVDAQAIKCGWTFAASVDSLDTDCVGTQSYTVSIPSTFGVTNGWARLAYTTADATEVLTRYQFNALERLAKRVINICVGE